VESLPVPVILTGGLRRRSGARGVRGTGAAAVMLARGALGNPWLFEQLLGGATQPAARTEVLAELDWVIDRAVEHLGEERATRYLRKFYPWYVERLALDRRARPSACSRSCRRRDARSRSAALCSGAPPALAA
jgi:tRNA-dihydrouridine synthase B